MTLNHTGHELYKCAKVTATLTNLFFNGLIASTGHFSFICA